MSLAYHSPEHAQVLSAAEFSIGRGIAGRPVPMCSALSGRSAPLIVSQFGAGSGADFGMSPADVEQRLRDSATDTPCPEQNPFAYPDLIGADPNVPFEAFCEGDADFRRLLRGRNRDALNAVTAP